MSASALALPVRVTRHSIERYRQRLRRTPSVREIQADVRAALEEGRVACRKPAFLNQKRVKNHGRGKIRFAWTEDRDRVYVLRLHSNETVVLTVEVPQ